MKLRVEKSDLTDAVGWAARAVPTRPTIPILSGVLISADGQGLTLSGFDFEEAARTTVDAAVAESGRVLVSGRLLADITRALPAAPVDLATDGSRLTLRCGSARFELPTLPVEDYPALPDLPAVSGRITAPAFAAAVAQVAVAAGRDDVLPALTGIRVEIDGEQLTLVATDRYRLAVRELRWRPEAATGEVPSSALVPARTLADIAKAMAGVDGEVTVAFAPGTDSLVGFEGGRRVATTRLLDGEFPRYRGLLPSSTEASAVCGTEDLIAAVRRVSLVLPAARVSPIQLSFNDGEVVIEAGEGDQAQARERVEVHYEGQPMAIAFNPGFLVDGLNALDSDTATLALTTPGKPAVLTGKSSDFRYLLMPMRLGG